MTEKVNKKNPKGIQSRMSNHGPIAVKVFPKYVDYMILTSNSRLLDGQLRRKLGIIW